MTPGAVLLSLLTAATITALLIEEPDTEGVSPATPLMPHIGRVETDAETALSLDAATDLAELIILLLQRWNELQPSDLLEHLATVDWREQLEQQLLAQAGASSTEGVVIDNVRVNIDEVDEGEGVIQVRADLDLHVPDKPGSRLQASYLLQRDDRDARWRVTDMNGWTDKPMPAPD